MIRTRRKPFWKSKPGKYLLASSLTVVAVALILPYTPIGKLFEFVPPPPAFYLALLALVGTYLIFAEVVKNWFYKRQFYRLEQARIPKRPGYNLTRNARLTQDLVAAIALRNQDEMSIDSINEDLATIVIYPIDQDQVIQSLHHLRRAGLITVDWHKGAIKREKTIKDYIAKTVRSSEMWPTMSEDWKKLLKITQDKYGSTNPDYQSLLNQKTM